jgi:tRNA(Ile)-lysidine synthase
MEDFGLREDERLALAVSGGGDSAALMRLAASWARTTKRQMPIVLTVDHRLRPGSAKEANAVRRWARDLGCEAHVLRWIGAKPVSNLEEAARDARYRLMGEWCRAHGVTALVLAHTRDDQAETFLLRLARGSGLDGLSAMHARAALPVPGLDEPVLLRPLLGLARSDLRRFLAAEGVSWHEDPMNDDPRFARVRLRALMPALEGAGLSAARIAQAASHLARARQALDAETESFLAGHAFLAPEGYALLDAMALRMLPREIALRAIASLLAGISGDPLRPRFAALENLMAGLLADGRFSGQTLHGCRIVTPARHFCRFGSHTVLFAREARGADSAPALTVHPGQQGIWDGRFRIALSLGEKGAKSPGKFHIRAWGSGSATDCVEHGASIPAPARAALPALYCGEKRLGPAITGAISGLNVDFLGIRR